MKEIEVEFCIDCPMFHVGGQCQEDTFCEHPDMPEYKSWLPNEFSGCTSRYSGCPLEKEDLLIKAKKNSAK